MYQLRLLNRSRQSGTFSSSSSPRQMIGRTCIAQEVCHRTDPFLFVDSRSREDERRAGGEASFVMSNLSSGPVYPR